VHRNSSSYWKLYSFFAGLIEGNPRGNPRGNPNNLSP
jgi:hypothetical protein